MIDLIKYELENECASDTLQRKLAKLNITAMRMGSACLVQVTKSNREAVRQMASKMQAEQTKPSNYDLAEWWVAK